MNVDEQKVGKVQDAAVHDQLEVRLRNYIVLDTKEQENKLVK